MTDITKHKDWPKWFTRIYKVIANPQRVGAGVGPTFVVSAPTIDSAEKSLVDVAPLIFAAGREAERDIALAHMKELEEEVTSLKLQSEARQKRCDKLYRENDCLRWDLFLQNPKIQTLIDNYHPAKEIIK